MVNSVQWLFEAQKSSAFSAAMQLVAENEINGETKFTRKVCHELGRILVCRNYAPAVLELCHLLYFVHAFGPDRPDKVEYFFWGTGLARSHHYRNFLQQQCAAAGPAAADFTLTTDGAQIDCRNIRFSISFNRIPLLAALLEFLMTVLGYPALDAVFTQLRSPQIHRHALQQTASDLSRQLYQYLKAQLPTAQLQRKFHRLIDLLSTLLPNGFDYLAINDPIVLHCWLQESVQATRDSVDFKTFTGVFDACRLFRHSLQQAQTLPDLMQAAPIGSDREAGEIDPQLLQQQLEIIELPENNSQQALAQLQAPPCDAIKFLTRRQQQAISVLATTGAQARAFPLSILRTEVFEPTRKRLTQALRDQRTPQQRQALIQPGTDNRYALQVEAWQQLAEQVETLLLASLHILLQPHSAKTSSAALALAVLLRPELDLTPYIRSARNHPLDPLHSASNCQTNCELLRQALLQADPASPVAQQLLQPAQQAFRKTHRRGFKTAEMSSTATLQGLVAGYQPLARLWQQLRDYLQQLTKHPAASDAWCALFTADNEIFSRQFHSLYIEPLASHAPHSPVAKMSAATEPTDHATEAPV